MYYMNTFNHLHRAKKIFRTKADMMAFLQKIVKKCPYELSQMQLEESIFVMHFDENDFPEYTKVFKIKKKMLPPLEKADTDAEIEHPESKEWKSFKEAIKLKTKDFFA